MRMLKKLAAYHLTIFSYFINYIVVNKLELNCILDTIDSLQKITPRKVPIAQFHAKSRASTWDNNCHR
jgi:hypothetical protein